MDALLPLFAEGSPAALEEAAASHRSMALLMFACAFVSLLCLVVRIIRRRARAQDATPGRYAARPLASARRLSPPQRAPAADGQATGACRLEVCPNCRYRVVAKADGRCPSCQFAMASPRFTT